MYRVEEQASKKERKKRGSSHTLLFVACCLLDHVSPIRWKPHTSLWGVINKQDEI
jgi:hypothetical protein